MNDPIPGAGPSASEQVAVRELLVADRARTTSRIAGLTRDFEGIVDSSTAVATDDEHDPEGATLAFERAQVVALLEQARGHLLDLDRALARLAEGTYGTCERCGGHIAVERLAARPAATTCIRCAAAPR
jgi:DnaK suppressor protein